jgi:hypothetical protein
MLTASVTIQDAMLTEGDSGSAEMDFVLHRSGDLAPAMVLSYATVDGTAVAGADYTAQTGNVTIPANAQTAVIHVPVAGEILEEEDETFSVQLTGIVSVTGADFELAPAQRVKAGAYSVQVADLNNDGSLDIVTTSGRYGNLGWAILNKTKPGRTRLAFTAAQDFAVASTPTCPRSIAAADFNADGKIDLAMANLGASTVSVVLNMTAPGSDTLNLLPTQDFAAQTYPFFAAAGDINGDGRPDLVVANQHSNYVSVFLNTTMAGSNTVSFAARQDFQSNDAVHNPASGDYSQSVAITDINGDSRVDLACVNSTGRTVSVLLNTTESEAGVASFSPWQEFDTGPTWGSVMPVSVSAGDINGDSRPDLAVANELTNTVSILLNTTAPGAATASFAARQDLATPEWPQSVVVDDLDGDGRPDLSVVSSRSSATTVSVFLNATAAGATTVSFAARQDYHASDYSTMSPQSVITGDMNGDGRRDVVVNDNNWDVSVSVLLNTPLTLDDDEAIGTIVDDDRPAVTLSLSGSPLAENGGTATVTATLASAATQDVTVNLGYSGLATRGVDFSGDTAIVIPAGSLAASVTLTGIDDAADEWTETIVIDIISAVNAIEVTPQQVTASIIDDDDVFVGPVDVQIIDAVVSEGNAGSTDMVFTLMRSGNRTPEITFSYETVEGTDGPVATADSDFEPQSGTVTIPVGEESTAVRVPVFGDVFPEGDETLTLKLTGVTSMVGPAYGFPDRQEFGLPEAPARMALGDINADGLPDAVITYEIEGMTSVSALLNETTAGATAAQFSAEQAIPIGSCVYGVALSDLNADGRPDLVVTAPTQDRVSVLLNTTPPEASAASFGDRQDFATGDMPWALAAGDFNGDGRPDLAVAYYGASTVSVLLNTTAAGSATVSFAAAQNLAVAAQSMAITDLNGDGRPDLVAAAGGNSVSVLLNTTAPGGETASFAPRLDFAVAGQSRTVAVGDVNNDGRPDVAATTGSNVVSVLVNTTPTGSGTASFSAKQDFAVREWPGPLAIEDLDGDGRADLAVSYLGHYFAQFYNNVSVLINSTPPGDTTVGFEERRDFWASFNARSRDLGIDDLNADGRPDLAVATYPSWYDNDHTLSVLLNRPLTYDSLGAGTIANDDGPPVTVSLPGAPISLAENGGTAVVTATLADAAAQDVTVYVSYLTYSPPYNVNATPDDFVASENAIHIPAGARSGSTTITGVDDAVYEHTQRFYVQITGVANAVAAWPELVEVWILDDDPPPRVTIDLAGGVLSENGGVATVTATLSAISERIAGIWLGFGGTAAKDSDYSASHSNLNVWPGDLSASITLTGIDDAVVEGTESIIVDGTEYSFCSLTGERRVIADLLDDDPPLQLLDFGDAPDGTSPADHFPTLSSSDGARHVLGSGLFLGTSVDVDADGQPNATATGDDVLDRSDDEDGVTFSGALLPGTTNRVTIVASGTGFVDAWLDVNGDGTWTHPDEQTLAGVPVVAGGNEIDLLVPDGVVGGKRFARFRLSSTGGLAPTGLAADGEVEDYQVDVFGQGPTDIGLSGTSIAENQPVGTSVGVLSTTDPDTGETFVYTLVAGAGDTDNASFAIAGDQLQTAAVFDYEAKSSYSVRVRTTDQGGLWYEKAFTVTVTDVNAAPTEIGLSSASVAENRPAGTVVGTLSSVDGEPPAAAFTYLLVAGTGSTDNGRFTIVGDQLKTAAVFDYETKNSYAIRVRSTDQGGLPYEKAFTITVTNVNETPSRVALAPSSVAENQPVGTVVGMLSTTDPDAGNTFTYTLVPGAGDADNGSFAIVGNQVLTLATFDYETKNAYAIRVRTTDQGGLPWEQALTVTVNNLGTTGAIPYTQDFSAGKPESDREWDFYRTGEGRIDVVGGQLRMDDTVTGGQYSLNEAILHVNLVGQGNVQLKLDHQTFGDETHKYAQSQFAGSVNADLIAVSVNGINWVKVTDLTTSFTAGSFDLDALLPQAELAAGATDRSDVRIKFQQYDNDPWGTSSRSSDGRGFDNIRVTGTPLLYRQNFSAGQPGIDQGWEYYSTPEGRIQVVSGQLRMDDSIKGSLYSLNEAILHLNLVGQGNVQLKLDHQTFGDETHKYAPAQFAYHVNADLIAVSVNGINWVKVTDLTTSFAGKPFDLDALLQQAEQAAGSTDRSDVRIKFQQYDNDPWGTSSRSSDGRAFDNIQVTGAPLVYRQDFSAGQPGIDQGWEYHSTAEGRIQVVSGQLRMDDSVKGSLYSLNEAILHLNLTNRTSVLLKLDHQMFGDETHKYAQAQFAGSVNADLIAVSVNGINWVKVTDLTTSFTGQSFGLDALLQQAELAAGSTDRSDVRIKFQQYDNDPWGTSSRSSDGRAFDNIQVTAIESLPLKAVTGRVPSAPSCQVLSQADLSPLVEAAIDQWADSGLSGDLIRRLQQIHFVITDLPGSDLGRASLGTIYIDADAAGYGWFVDRTPSGSAEFRAIALDAQLPAVDSQAVDRIDLLTVVSHELGHVAGLDDLALSGDGLMSGGLAPGMRRAVRAADVDAVLASGSLFAS